MAQACFGAPQNRCRAGYARTRFKVWQSVQHLANRINYFVDEYWSRRVVGAALASASCIFVPCVVAFRKGFVGELLAWQQRRKAKS